MVKHKLPDYIQCSSRSWMLILVMGLAGPGLCSSQHGMGLSEPISSFFFEAIIPRWENALLYSSIQFSSVHFDLITQLGMLHHQYRRFNAGPGPH